ncbi:hypothetical protein BG015_007248 [Linnemannia schmuckeri]|uniref:Uncharacterized protein n=1 Tax=Linnemannia schmuckeri TaxID=64567 RepID=A0A9P5VBJ8_9FUNG|nr:hypothetical protein BG015_007248 [Linnemannia schmuckeri]
MFRHVDSKPSQTFELHELRNQIEFTFDRHHEAVFSWTNVSNTRMESLSETLTKRKSTSSCIPRPNRGSFRNTSAPSSRSTFLWIARLPHVEGLLISKNAGRSGLHQSDVMVPHP